MPREEMVWTIYLIRNAVNGKGYVGITQKLDIERRLADHCFDSAHLPEGPCGAYMSNGEIRPLYAAMRKYGVEKFSIEELESFYGDTLGDAQERETYYIEKLQTYASGPMHRRNGYNVTHGGEYPFDD